MKHTKLLAMVLALCLSILMLAGCSSGSEGVLKVATSPDFAPMEFVDVSKSGQDQYVGFDITLAKYIAEELNMTLELHPMSFEACQAAVSTGNVDMAISGFSWLPEREEGFNLSDYYYPGDNETEQVVITTKDKEGQFTSAADMAGMTVAAQTASLQMTLCNEQLADCEIIEIGDLNTALMQLQSGDFDFLAVAKGQADVFISNNPDVAFSGFAFEVDPRMVGNVVLLPKGADDLTAQVNDALAKAEAAGLYGQWYAEAEELAGVDTASEISFDDEGNAIEG